MAGDASLLDNVLLPAIVSLARLIEHPGDSLARRHIEMSPLHPQVALTPADLAQHGRRIREQGYAGWLTHLAATLSLPPDAAYEQKRLRKWIALTADFDRQPGRTALRFAAFAESLRLPAPRTGSRIEVLTMHKAKGLEYDVVLLPTLKGHVGITSQGGGEAPLMIHEAPGDEPVPTVDWILSPPVKTVLEADPVLSAQAARNRQSGALAELRLLYVAMTRAKRALHLFTTEPVAKSSTLYLETVVQNTLAPDAPAHPEQPVFQQGSPRWWERSFAPPKSDLPSPPCPAPLDFSSLPATPAQPQLVSKTASDSHGGPRPPAGRFFRPEGAAARDLGTRVHALFEQIEWLAPGEIPTFAEANPTAAHLVAGCLQNAALHRLLERPAGNVELLREQAFEAILDGKWLSGKIDRLHLERDDDGIPVRARVLDFKTDQTFDPDRHRPQMEDYRQAVAWLFALPPAQVACTLLFVRSDKAVNI